MAKARATILVPDAEDEHPDDYHWVVDWLIRWEKGVRIVGYDFRDLAHVWDVEGGTDAIAELPKHLLRQTPWVLKGGKSRSATGKMKFSISRAKRLRNRARRGEGTSEDSEV